MFYVIIHIFFFHSNNLPLSRSLSSFYETLRVSSINLENFSYPMTIVLSFVIMLHCCIEVRALDKTLIMAGLSNFQSRVTRSQSYYNALANYFTVGDSIEHMC